MKEHTNIKTGFISRNRYWIMFLSLLLFLPPLSFLFQLSGEVNFCGTWCPRMFFVWNKGTSFGNYLFGFIRSYMGVILVLGVLVTTFFLGRHWCSHICPVGGSMELGSRFVPKFMKIDFSKIPAPAFRYGYFSIYIIAAAAGIGSLCCSYCNFGTIPRLFGAVASQADLSYFLRTAGLINLGLIAVLGFFAKGGRAYCNLLCPVGALDAISNRIGAGIGKRMVVLADKCSGCGKCAKECPLWAVEMSESARIDQLSCLPCGKCSAVCPKGAINYGKVSVRDFTKQDITYEEA